ncbi:hypothetical protein SAMN05421538_106198 [Paracoccus isoporae]|uniref:Uncharacterized protein n=1 Tax=Paracoccus isoporae TaxID=591205 RepID=A0A1G7CV58_9RHOB|nr:hypothetical protein [Paracoccus isoporae]SDE42385.1 hypothetical protein SAMN05421538_106198 [Paracoccus isoporae]
MMTAFRACLILCLLLTSHGLAAARGQPRVAEQQVLCLGGAAVQMLIGADGKPVRRLVLCADLALNVISAVVADPGVPVAPMRQTMREPAVAVPFTTSGRDTPPAQARGPPIMSG